jgi:hypothetical protein
MSQSRVSTGVHHQNQNLSGINNNPTPTQLRNPPLVLEAEDAQYEPPLPPLPALPPVQVPVIIESFWLCAWQTVCNICSSNARHIPERERYFSEGQRCNCYGCR